MKYAFLHCSYAAPVRVSVIVDDVWSIAARDTTGVCARLFVFGATLRVLVDARETVFDAARDIVVAAGLAPRAFIAERGVVFFVAVF